MKISGIRSSGTLIKFVTLVFSLMVSLNVFAAEDFTINTPGVHAIKQIMQARHPQLAFYYANGAVGMTADGMIGLRDVSVVPQAERYTVYALIGVENQNRNALYAEIALANGHPEWEGKIRNAFAKRWIHNAQRGWWVQDEDGWEQK